MSDRETDPRNGSVAVAALMAAVAAVQLWLAHRYFGFLTGDDVEVVAEAFRVARGFHYRAWDIRNLFVPDFIVAPPIALAARLGVSSTRRLIEIAALPSIAACAATAWMLYRLTLRWTADHVASIAASAMFALHWIPLGFGSTVYPRNVGTACIVAAALLVTSQSRYGELLAGLLVGVAFADRFSEIVFLAPLLILARRRLLLLVGAAVSIVLLVGVYDYATWGSAFSSVRNFARLTFIDRDFASRAKFQPPLWYVSNIARWCAATLFPLFYFARKSAAARRAAWFVAIPLLVLSCIHHKELRYLQGLIPFVAMAAGAGFALLWRDGYRRTAVALLGLSLLWNLQGIRFLRHKTMPAVQAAEMLGADPSVRGVTMSQLWAYGDRLYFGDRMQALDVGTPPRDFRRSIESADAVAVYESDLTPDGFAALREKGFALRARFRDRPARTVVVFQRK